MTPKSGLFFDSRYFCTLVFDIIKNTSFCHELYIRSVCTLTSEISVFDLHGARNDYEISPNHGYQS